MKLTREKKVCCFNFEKLNVFVGGGVRSYNIIEQAHHDGFLNGPNSRWLLIHFLP